MNLKTVVVLLLLYYLVKILSIYSLNGKNGFVAFLNVGQGDASLVRLVGVGDIIIDTGPDDSFEDSIRFTKLFFQCNYKSIFLSHFHADHIYGVANILNRCNNFNPTFNDISVYSNSVSEFIQNNQFSLLNSQNHISLKSTDSDQKISYKLSSRETVDLYILWPKKNSTKLTDENDNSLVILFDMHDFEILYTGDVSGEILNEIVTPEVLLKIDNGLDVLKVSHHGSITGRSLAAYKKLRPRHCVISVGNNTFGHPSREVLADIKATNCILHRTDVEGNVVFKL